MVADAFRRLSVEHHSYKLADTTLEEDTCELLCLYLLFISDHTYCFSLEIEEILFPLAPQIVEAEKNLELQSESSTNIRTYINKVDYDWKYKPDEGINLVHYCCRIYVPKTLRKCVIKWYHCYLQHPGGDILSQALTTVCRWSDIYDQSQKICRIYKDCQKFKKRNA